MDNRPSWDEYYAEMLDIVSKRSTCLRRHVSAIIVKDNKMISSGYNGSPKGLRHCEEVGCIRTELNIPSGERHELCRGIHAEQNAIIQAAVHGVSIKDSVIYVSHSPCVLCAKMIINAGIKQVKYLQGYPDESSLEILSEAGVEVIKLGNE
ncbi:MAG: cytidine deaminase [Anaerofustis stercorihominis]|nr:cytidine deaminase [Anaerofustis stercorihominis]